VSTSQSASLAESVAPDRSRCRCGTSIEIGDRVLEVRGLPHGISPLFGKPSFCSGRCARAEFLEIFEVFDAMVGSTAESMVNDLRLTYAELARAFAQVLNERIALLR
jgi:hypothetical protein